MKNLDETFWQIWQHKIAFSCIPYRMKAWREKSLVNFTKLPNFIHQTFCNSTTIISILIFWPNFILIFYIFTNFSLTKLLSYTVSSICTNSVQEKLNKFGEKCLEVPSLTLIIGTYYDTCIAISVICMISTVIYYVLTSELWLATRNLCHCIVL